MDHNDFGFSKWTSDSGCINLKILKGHYFMNYDKYDMFCDFFSAINCHLVATFIEG